MYIESPNTGQYCDIFETRNFESVGADIKWRNTSGELVLAWKQEEEIFV